MTSRNYVGEKHIEVLVEFLSHHLDLARGRLRCRDGRAKSIQLWEEAAILLNAEGGQGRNGKGWNKWYTDYKSRLLNKNSVIKQNQTGTGGGAGKHVTPLTNLEERLLSLLGANDSVTGRDGEQLGSTCINPLETAEDSLSLTNTLNTSSVIIMDPINVEEQEAQFEFIDSFEEQSVPVVAQPPRKKRKTVDKEYSSQQNKNDQATNDNTLANLTNAYKEMADAIRSLSSAHEKLSASHEKLASAVDIIAQQIIKVNMFEHQPNANDDTDNHLEN